MTVAFPAIPRARRVLALGIAAVIGLGIALVPSSAHAAWGYHTIGNYHSGKCLDDTNGSTASGNQMQQWTCLFNSNQEWRTINGFEGLSVNPGDAVGWAQLQNLRSGLCLDLAGGSSANGAHVIQYRCNVNDLAQRWSVYKTNIANFYVYVNQAPGSLADSGCMTVSADSQANGAKIQGWQCNTAFADHSYFWGSPF